MSGAIALGVDPLVLPAVDSALLGLICVDVHFVVMETSEGRSEGVEAMGGRSSHNEVSTSIEDLCAFVRDSMCEEAPFGCELEDSGESTGSAMA